MSLLPNTTAVILAGGLGTRLRPVISDKPKVLAEVCGRPFIEHLLNQLEAAGVRVAVLCTGYLADEVEKQVGTRHGKLEVRYSRELTRLGTGGALRLALPLLDSDPVLVLNGDSYTNASLEEFADWHEAHPSPASILLSATEDTQRYGRVDVDDDGRIVRFTEKSRTLGSGWINAGIYLLRRDIIHAIKPDAHVSLEQEVFPAWVGLGLHGFRSSGRLWDIGLPEALTLANMQLANYVYKS